uniref:Uncharacterized protein n=1 Tax=Lepeophtheirus salmonis TaxID=72036 RepID=A0A0K2TEG4_LEPSM
MQSSVLLEHIFSGSCSMTNLEHKSSKSSTRSIFNKFSSF